MKRIARNCGVTFVFAAFGARPDPGRVRAERHAPNAAVNGPAPDTQRVPQSRAMGGAKSVTTFFVTSKGVGKGGDLGGLAGADTHCQALAGAEGSGDHMWRAYLSTTATADCAAVNARDRIGKGPWYNAGGELVAANIDQLHTVEARIDQARPSPSDSIRSTESATRPTPTTYPDWLATRRHGIRRRARISTCGNWTSSGPGRAQVGHHDRMGQGASASSWNSAHSSRGCTSGPSNGWRRTFLLFRH